MCWWWTPIQRAATQRKLLACRCLGPIPAAMPLPSRRSSAQPFPCGSHAEHHRQPLCGLQCQGDDRDSWLIALAESEEEARKLFQVGANEAVQPQPGIGQKLAVRALQPPSGRLSVILSRPDCMVREFRLTSKQALFGVLGGATLGGLRLGAQTGAMVLAIRSPRWLDALTDSGKGSKPGATEFVMANPIDEVRLEPGQTLVVLGSRSQLQQVQELLGPLVE
jgi:voltage-gated potassium channel